MNCWPEVLSEDETLDALLEGMSLARFGDGEFNLLHMGKCVTQEPSRELALALRVMLAVPEENLLVGIPRMTGPKKEFWKQYDRRTIHRLMGRDIYASAFITRPDSAPWIDRADYWKKLRLLWKDRKVTLVRGSAKSLTRDMLHDARDVHEIIVPKRNAFYLRQFIFEHVGKPDVVLLCCGPTATVLAHDLSVQVQAIDMGHVGMFLRKHLKGEPMMVTAADKAVDHEVAS